MKYKTVSTIAAILCGTLLAFVVRAQENEQVKAAATRPNCVMETVSMHGSRE